MGRGLRAGVHQVCGYPARIWVNGHEWAKRQAVKAGIAFTELANGFASCEDPAGLQAKARAVNSRILNAERAGQATVLASPAFERIAHPSTDADGRRTPALRFGDPRVMALD